MSRRRCVAGDMPAGRLGASGVGVGLWLLIWGICRKDGRLGAGFGLFAEAAF